MCIFLQNRADGNCALYIDGDLQFDTSDEAIYHESLVLPALILASRKKSDNLRVLISGGGDGLALRETLRFPGVAHVDLVDYSQDVVDLGMNQLSKFNLNSFGDSRVSVHIADAWEFMKTDGTYDAIIVDLTVPRKPEDTSVFSAEWYKSLQHHLSDTGVISVNGFSPEATPEAFWCLNNTIKSTGLHALPFRVCIPSFREQGYGVWSFFLVSNQELTIRDLKSMRSPVLTRQSDISRLHRGASFSRATRAAGKLIPVHSMENPVLLPLLLNRALPQSEPIIEGFDIEPLIAAIPALHPQHTRDMIEVLAHQVAGSIRFIDISKLVDALLKRVAELPGKLIRELKRLKEYLQNAIFPSKGVTRITARLFAALVITMTLANAVAPDNAFAKGGIGIGHASMGRGFSGGFAGGRAGSPSAGGTGARGGFSSSHPTFNTTNVRVSGTGFRGASYGRGGMTDMYGYHYTPRVYIYCGGGYGHYHPYYVAGHSNYRPQHIPGEQHQAMFVADEDMLIMDNGDIIITLSDKAYLLLAGGQLSLMNVNSVDPITPVATNTAMLTTIVDELNSQKLAIQHEIGARRDWISWTGWSSALFSKIKEDKSEVANMEDLIKRIDLALKQVGAPAQVASNVPSTDHTELFVGGFLRDNGDVLIQQPDGRWLITNGKTMRFGEEGKSQPCPKELRETLSSIMLKLQKELMADLNSYNNEMTKLQNEKRNIDGDLATYNSLYQMNAYDPNYEVDYGTDTMSVSRAMSLTEKDKADNEAEIKSLEADHLTGITDLQRLNSLIPSFGK